jgi:hypothetical protein
MWQSNWITLLFHGYSASTATTQFSLCLTSHQRYTVAIELGLWVTPRLNFHGRYRHVCYWRHKMAPRGWEAELLYTCAQKHIDCDGVFGFHSWYNCATQVCADIVYRHANITFFCHVTGAIPVYRYWCGGCEIIQRENRTSYDRRLRNSSSCVVTPLRSD